MNEPHTYKSVFLLCKGQSHYPTVSGLGESAREVPAGYTTIAARKSDMSLMVFRFGSRFFLVRRPFSAHTESRPARPPTQSTNLRRGVYTRQTYQRTTLFGLTGEKTRVL